LTVLTVSPVCFFPDPKVKTAWQLQRGWLYVYMLLWNQ